MTWAALSYAAYNSEVSSVFAVNGSLRKRFEGTYGFEWGIDAPVTLPAISAGSATGLTGAYDAQYTYARKERAAIVCESNPSGKAVAPVSLSDQDMIIYGAAPEDEQVNCLRFYRTTANGTSWYHLVDLHWCNLNYAAVHTWEADGEYETGKAYRFTLEFTGEAAEVTHTWELLYNRYAATDSLNHITSPADNIYRPGSTWGYVPGILTSAADDTLGTLVAEDHDRIPAGCTYIMGPTHNGVIFAVLRQHVYYCKPNQPEYWPANYYIDVGGIDDPIHCGVLYGTGPFFLTRRDIYQLVGAVFADLPGLTTYRPISQAAKCGTMSPLAATAVEGLGVFHVGPDGLYAFKPGTDSILGADERISTPVDRIFQGESVNGIPAASDLTTSWLEWFDDKLFFGYAGAESYPRNVLVFDPRRSKITYYQYPWEISCVINDRWHGRLLACRTTGELWRLETPGANADEGIAIEWEAESKQFLLQTRAHYPRWNKYDVDASNSVSAYGYALLDGEIITTHTLAENRKVRRRLIDLANGNRYAIRLAGSGPISIYAVESE